MCHFPTLSWSTGNLSAEEIDLYSVANHYASLVRVTGVTSYYTLVDWRLPVGRHERMHKLRNGNDTAIWAAEEIERLVEALVSCRHQASYSIGCEDALRNQLNKVREIVNDTIKAGCNR